MDLRHDVKRIFGELNPRERALLWLAHVEESDHQEIGEALGVIRTEELLAARRIDGAEQFFSRAIDFGYTKSPQETLSIWDRDKILADIVWVIRKFQPDVLITRFPTTGEGGHGQHTASAILAEEAFHAAGDPSRFPEQLQYVTVWQPKRIFWNRFSFRPQDPNAPELANDLRVDLGGYNPLLGRSYTEIAGERRSQHKSQGFGAAQRRGSQINYLKFTGGVPPRTAAAAAAGVGGATLGGVAAGAGILVSRSACIREAIERIDGMSPLSIARVIALALATASAYGLSALSTTRALISVRTILP